MTHVIIKNHERKLENFWWEQRIKSLKCIINLSKRKLSLKEEKVLRFGLNCHILPNKTDVELKVYVKRLMYLTKSKLKITQFG